MQEIIYLWKKSYAYFLNNEINYIRRYVELREILDLDDLFHIMHIQNSIPKLDVFNFNNIFFSKESSLTLFFCMKETTETRNDVKCDISTI